MPYSNEHKQKSRESILKSAVKCFSRKGFENTSIDEIMTDASLTRGAFYAHFKSKSDLYQQALQHGARNSHLLKEKPADFSDEQWLKQLIKMYLSPAHVNKVDMPCPLAFLVTDVAISEPAVQATYARAYQRMNKLFRQYASRFTECDNDTVYAITAMMIGGVAIGRSLNNNASLNKLLNACEATIFELLRLD